MRTRWGRFLMFSSALGFLASSAFAAPKKSEPKKDPPATTAPAKPAKKPAKPRPGDAEELGGDEAEAKAGAPSPQYQKAKKFLDQERWADAAVEFHTVLRTGTDDPGNTQHAQYWLAVALYHLEYYQASYTYFSEIAKQPKHLDFEKTLGWLARLATQLPEPADIIGHLGKYSEEQVQATAKGSPELLAQLNFLFARYKYRKGDFEKAQEIFRRVPKDSKFGVPALFFAGITSVRLRKIKPAVEAFDAILTTLDDNPGAVDEPGRYRDLANLSKARAYYSAAIKQPTEGEFQPDPERLTAAVVAWNKVDVASEYWLDALFEESWAYFMAQDYPHALGNIHTIESPYFPNSFYPEAEFLKAIIYFTNCQYENAKIIVAQFVKKYEPIQKGLKDLLDSQCPGPKPDDEGNVGDLSPDEAKKCLGFLESFRAGKVSGLKGESGRAIKPVLDGAFSDRELLKNLEYIRQIKAEEDRLKGAKAPIKGSQLSGEVSSTLDNAISDAITKAGTLARARFLRSLDELDEHLGNVQTMLIDIMAGERGELEKLGDAAAGAIKAQQTQLKGLGDVKADEEHYLWPFEGEYWRDELGFYRQKVVSTCGGRS
ncbi:MAG: tetratricopeptide repeat protein [Polyangiales bacterium]